MRADLEKIKKEFEDQLATVSSALTLEALEQQFFARKNGRMTLFLKSLKDVSDDVKKTVGQAANDIKKDMESLLDKKKKDLRRAVADEIGQTESIDVTEPKLPSLPIGHLHPNTLVQKELEDLFTSMGFMVLDGPELESDYYNFTAVNIPPHHPARDMQDTFYIKNHPSWVMRTHTSSVQVRAMREYGAPLRAIVPGRCFRNEATDARHEHTFNQLEGFVIGKDIGFAHMKGVLETVAKHLYGQETKIRMRPKFYPFVEPGANGEVTCFLCKGTGCRVCKNTGWLEIFGAGLIHPNVLKQGHIDPNEYQGFAFGLGLTRLVMLKYGIEDVRHLQSGDIKFLQQF